jgi:hypothetical protein
MAIRKLFSSKKVTGVVLDEPLPPVEPAYLPPEEPAPVHVVDPDELPHMVEARARMELRRTAEVEKQNPPEIFTMEARPAKRQRKERRRGNKKA